MIFYFSGTGNSKGIAEYLAKALRDRAVNIIGTDPRNCSFQAEERVGFVFPVYGYVAPKVMLDFASQVKADGVYTFAVPTFSNVAGCTLEHFSKSACRLDGGFGIKMPDNMPVFDKVVETRETAIEKIRRAAPRLREVKNWIQGCRKGFDIDYGENPEQKTWEQGVHYLVENPFKTVSYHVASDKCVSCGLCQELCPAGVIRMEGDKPIWTESDCYMCMACLNRCPTEAIQYGAYSEGKYRYFFRGLELSKY